MKMQLLIAIRESDYAEHLSRVLTERDAELFEVSVCTSPEHLAELLRGSRFDAALLDGEMARGADLSTVRLPLLVWDGVSEIDESLRELPRLRKYQRVSAISSDVTQRLAAAGGGQEGLASGRAAVTAVWSPAGGVGKTTVALALAINRAAAGKRAVFLELEPFSTAPVLFREPGQSISTVFEKLDADTALLCQGIRQQDAATGVYYFGRPRNYDDMNLLTQADVTTLIEGCAAHADEVIVDLGSACGPLTRRVLELADRVLLAVDGSTVCQSKYGQFRTQHDLYAAIAGKLTVAANRGARNAAAPGEQCVSLPKVDSADPVTVCRTLAAYIP